MKRGMAILLFISTELVGSCGTSFLTGFPTIELSCDRMNPVHHRCSLKLCENEKSRDHHILATTRNSTDGEPWAIIWRHDRLRNGGVLT